MWSNTCPINDGQCINQWAAETRRRWEKSKFVKLWVKKQKAGRDPHQAFLERSGSRYGGKICENGKWNSSRKELRPTLIFIKAGLFATNIQAGVVHGQLRRPTPAWD